MNISIITPIFNTSIKYFEDCKKSIESLYLVDVESEWIVINDGCSEESSKKVQNILSTYKGKPKLLYESLSHNQGLSTARNYAVSKSSGKYILFLDADDRLAKHTIMTMLSYCMKGVSLLFSDSWDCDKEMNVLLRRRKRKLFDLHVRYKGTKYDPLLYFDFVYQPQLIKRSDFDAIDGFNETLHLGEDVDLLLRLSDLSKQPNFAYVSIPTYKYRNNPEGICNNLWKQLKSNYEDVFFRAWRRKRFNILRVAYYGEIKIDGAPFDLYTPILRSEIAMPYPFSQLANLVQDVA